MTRDSYKHFEMSSLVGKQGIRGSPAQGLLPEHGMDFACLQEAGARIGARISGLGCSKPEFAFRLDRDFLLSISARLPDLLFRQVFCDYG